ncbi:MAG: 16S rRNA (cytidine(1402)-2'-O)-methyltransferase [Actinomycetes bacterium]
MTGVLVLAGAPIGNPTDASARLSEVLSEADVVAAEDTRRLHRLVATLGVQLSAPVVSYHDGNEQQRTGELVARMLAGNRVVLVTDAGMPSVSDPGYRLVVAAIAAGVPVTAVPGPSAVLTALAVSGLACDRFCFEGFLPRRPGPRAARLAELVGEPRTLVLFEAPHRVAATLTDLAETFGPDRPAVVCRELTKTHEEVRRGRLDELAAWAAAGVRGEITVVVAGAPPGTPTHQDRRARPEDLAAQVATVEATGLGRKDAIREVARRTGRARRTVYDAVVKAGAAQPGAGLGQDGTDTAKSGVSLGLRSGPGR